MYYVKSLKFTYIQFLDTQNYLPYCYLSRLSITMQEINVRGIITVTGLVLSAHPTVNLGYQGREQTGWSTNPKR